MFVEFTCYYVLNIFVIALSAITEIENENCGPLTKILVKETSSKDVFIQKILIIVIPIYIPWTIIYGIYRFVKWFTKLPPI